MMRMSREGYARDTNFFRMVKGRTYSLTRRAAICMVLIMVIARDDGHLRLAYARRVPGASSGDRQITPEENGRTFPKSETYTPISPRFAEAQLNPKPQPPYINPCCQICPQNFMSLLEEMEISRSRKKTIYDRFHRFHSHHYYLGRDANSQSNEASPRKSSFDGSLDSFLEIEETASPTPVSLIKPGEEPCCALCPGGFDQAERMSLAGQKGGISFLEEEESYVEDEVSDRKKSYRKGSMDDDGQTSFLEMGFMGPKATDSSDKDFCCKICAAQFYAPRDYFDYETIADAAEMSFVEIEHSRESEHRAEEMSMLKKSGGGDSKSGSVGRGCCVACKSRMYGQVSDYADNLAADASSKAGKSGGPVDKPGDAMTGPSARNPENLRDYKAGSFSII